MTKEEIKEAVSEVLQEKLGDFFIERQKHFEHHQFIGELMNTAGNVKGTACKTVTIAGITGLLTILILGFIAWIKQHLN